MSGSVRSDELTVLCERCANPVSAHGTCPVCGDTRQSSSTTGGAEVLDEALVEQVGVALAAQGVLARRMAAARMETAAGLIGESLALRGRLRHQRALLRERVADRGAQARGCSEALMRVNQALQASGSLRFTHSEWRLRTRLPRDPSCPAVARRLVEGHVREDLDDRQTDAAMLIVSELTTNALVHGSGAILLAVSRESDRLRIEVSDDGHPQSIGVVPTEGRAAGGRGLFIVDQLASGWGRTAGTAHMWAELTLA